MWIQKLYNSNSFFPKIKRLPTHATAISPQQRTESQAKKRTTYTTKILSK